MTPTIVNLQIQIFLTAVVSVSSLPELLKLGIIC